MKKYLIIALLFCIINSSCNSAENKQNNRNVTLGIDKLIESNFAQLKGKKVGLFTNFSGRTQNGELTAEILAKSSQVNLISIFAPEHGFYGADYAGANIDNSQVFGIPIVSMYGATRRPPLEALQTLDVMLVDIQDIGIRSYTYISSVNYLLTACAEVNIPVIILDRPNPMSGEIVDGAITEAGSETFVSLMPIPYIHGLTIGELAIMMNKEGWLKNAKGEVQKCNLSVIKMEKWTRNMRWNDCGLIWYPTSPQITSPEAVFGCATLGIFGELSLLNIGIGTSLPFRYLGTPDLNVEKIQQELQKYNQIKNKEILIQPAHFKPFYGKFSGQTCCGFIFNYPNSPECKPFTAGVQTMLAIRKVHPELFNLKNIDTNKTTMFRKVTGGSKLLDALFGNASDQEVLTIANKGVADFIKIRKKYLLY